MQITEPIAVVAYHNAMALNDDDSDDSNITDLSASSGSIARTSVKTALLYGPSSCQIMHQFL